MKYICLGYSSEEKLEAMGETNQFAMMDECFAYDEELQRNGSWIGGEALQGPENAVTLRWQGGQVKVLDGPFTETKEHLGGILILEANDLNHAIQIMSKHPGVRLGAGFEIRPAEDLSQWVAESRVRREAKVG